MISLADALECFNRKERNLLVREILGHKDQPLQLSDTFRKRVADKLTLPPIPSNCWWATDYHLSWLAGALAVFVKGSPDPSGMIWSNPLQTNKPRLVEGNQQDIDLVIANGLDLILIEAKAYGHWSNSQLSRKLARLQLVYDFYGQISPSGSETVKFHCLVISPDEPKKLSVAWPTWSWRGDGIPWIPLSMERSPVLSVTRCTEDGKMSAEGDHWKVFNVE